MPGRHGREPVWRYADKLPRPDVHRPCGGGQKTARQYKDNVMDPSARTQPKQVPTLDIRRYDSDRAAFVAELGAAYREFGFCCISGHGITPQLIDGAYDAFQRFFALPAEAKM